jgi:hypothetical protein
MGNGNGIGDIGNGNGTSAMVNTIPSVSTIGATM